MAALPAAASGASANPHAAASGAPANPPAAASGAPADIPPAAAAVAATPPAAMAATAPIPARDAAALAATCANCHGPDGRSATGIPPLRGQSAQRLAERMRAFKATAASAADAGATVMPRLMRGYSDAQIDALAHWFAQPATAGTATPKAEPKPPRQKGAGHAR